jgi:pilus assembly protein CpaB
MNQRLLTVFVFAVMVAAIASYVVYRGVSAHVQMSAPAPSTHLFVAAHDLEVGTLVRDADVREADWPAAVPAQSISKREDLIGRGVVTKVFKDEPFVSERLAAQGAGAGLAATIPIGMRAVALRVNDVIGLAGFVLPGVRVDVVVSGNSPQSAQSGMMSRTVLQNIEVLSAGQKIEHNVEGKPEDAQVVNLLVTPEQAETLSLASNETRVQLVLRNPMDSKNEVTHGASMAGLFGVAAAPLPAMTGASRKVRTTLVAKADAKPSSAGTVEVFTGAKRSETMFAGTGSN